MLTTATISAHRNALWEDASTARPQCTCGPRPVGPAPLAPPPLKPACSRLVALPGPSVAVETTAMATRRSHTRSTLRNRVGAATQRAAHGALWALRAPGGAGLPCGALLQGGALPAAGRRAHVHPAAAGGLPEPRWVCPPPRPVRAPRPSVAPAPPPWPGSLRPALLFSQGFGWNGAVTRSSQPCASSTRCCSWPC